MNPQSLASALDSRYPGRLVRLAVERHVILTGPTASRTITLEIGDDVVRLSVGRIVHAEAYEDDGDIEQIVSVINAVDEGGAEELYGTTGGGLNGFIGYRIFGDGVAVTRLDDHADVVHRATL